MTLDELVNETLVQKNRRLRQEKCAHEEIHSSSFFSREVTIIDRVCLDCGKLWKLKLTKPA